MPRFSFTWSSPEWWFWIRQKRINLELTTIALILSKFFLINKKLHYVYIILLTSKNDFFFPSINSIHPYIKPYSGTEFEAFESSKEACSFLHPNIIIKPWSKNLQKFIPSWPLIYLFVISGEMSSQKSGVWVSKIEQVFSFIRGAS